MRIVSIVGARPQFVKLAPIVTAFRAADIEHVIVHTGQHYDASMSDAFFEGLSLPDPDFNLEVGSGSHGSQTGLMLAGIETTLLEVDPDWVLVYGDTNSTLAGVLAAAKLRIGSLHLEAGLRSFNRSMPEEINRIVTDHAADVLLAPTETAMANLRAEGLLSRSHLVGDVMADLCLDVKAKLSAGPNGSHTFYVVATLHRPSNTDDAARLTMLLNRLAALPMPVVLLAHPRLRTAAERAGFDLSSGALDARPPASYLDMMRLVANAHAVITDSGGLQKEAFLLQTPCITVRGETEWVETLTHGWNVLAPDADDLEQLLTRPLPQQLDTQPFGAGNAATTIARLLTSGGAQVRS